jgi:hypothetical protein
MPTDQNAFLITLKHVADKSGCYVTSEQVPGLHLIGRSAQGMKRMIEAAITALFKDNRGENVRVIWLTDVAKPQAVDDVPEHLAVYKIAA